MPVMAIRWDFQSDMWESVYRAVSVLSEWAFAKAWSVEWTIEWFCAFRIEFAIYKECRYGCVEEY